MNVIFETEDENSFSMKLDPNYTIYVIRAKIFRTTGTPMFHQTLLFQNRVLDNTSNVQFSSITPTYYRIQLRTKDPFRGLLKPPTVMELDLSISKHPERFLCLPINLSDTVLQLKQKLRQTSPRLGVHMYQKRHELQDAKCLSDYGFKGALMLNVFIKPPLAPFPPPKPRKKKGDIQVLT